ncbi:MAG: GtrA family protein [Clostridia bacterium]|nr:GtrA family protein [Clostridia bacterium]
MKEKFFKLIKSETASYLFFGVMTTAVNYLSFLLFLRILGYDYILTVNTISFVFAVTFAYITNKIFVFHSKSRSPKVLAKEILSFLSARLLSYFFEQLGLYLCVDVMHLEKYSFLGVDGALISKVALSFAVVLLNWAVSKFFIFKGNR